MATAKPIRMATDIGLPRKLPKITEAGVEALAAVLGELERLWNLSQDDDGSMVVEQVLDAVENGWGENTRSAVVHAMTDSRLDIGDESPERNLNAPESEAVEVPLMMSLDNLHRAGKCSTAEYTRMSQSGREGIARFVQSREVVPAGVMGHDIADLPQTEVDALTKLAFGRK